MKQVLLNIAIIATALWLQATIASAQSTQDLPLECRGRHESTGYRGGLRAGQSLARQAWSRLNDCDRVEEFEDVLLDTLSAYAPGEAPSSFSLCRFSGVVDGIVNELDAVFTLCTDACHEEGTFAGELSALAYCELSIALGGLATADAFIRGPVRVCGRSFQLGCDVTFMDVTRAYSNEIGACLDYTQGTFVPVWTQVRVNQCAYDPEPVSLQSTAAPED